MLLALTDEKRILAELMRELAPSNDEALVQVFDMAAEAMQATAPKAISTQLEQIAAALISMIPADKPVPPHSLYARLSALITSIQIAARKDQWSQTTDRVTEVVKHFPCTDDVYTGHCPVCGAPLLRFGHRDRSVINEFGEKEIYDLRRLRCKHCHRTHVELLDIMVPYHRHCATVVESVLDGTVNKETNSQISEWSIARLRRRFADMGATLAKEAKGRVGQKLTTIKTFCGGERGWLTALTFRLVAAGLCIIPKKMRVGAGNPPRKK